MYTGFYRVDIDNNKLKNGFISFRYRYKEDGRTKSISNTSLKELEKNVSSCGLEWKIIDEEKAYRTYLFDKNLSLLKAEYQENRLMINKKIKDEEISIQQSIKKKDKLLEDKKSIQKSFIQRKKEDIALYKEQMTHIVSQKNNVYSQNMSQIFTTTGFYLVSIVQCSQCKNSIIYRYQYQDEDGKRKKISSVDLDKLEERVKARGLEWKVIDKEKATKTRREWMKYKQNIEKNN